MKIISLVVTIVVASILLLWSSIALVVSASSSPTFNPAFSVNTNTNRIVDQYGRARFFHGANVVTKSAPFLPDTGDWNPNTSFVEKDMETLQSLGQNAIRLAAMFPGVLPHAGPSGSGWVNQTYLDALKKIVVKSASYGIHSLLDMHQDVMSEFFCGEGFPLWVVNDSLKASVPANMSFPWPLAPPYQTDADGIPLSSECAKHQWAEGYGTYAAAVSFQNFYDNVAGIRDKWVTAWQAIAQKFAGVGDAVLGLELLNEPFCGNIYAKKIGNSTVWGPEIAIPGIADLVNLQPTWEAGAAGIRAFNTEHPIFFEPITWDWIEPGFTQVPLGPAWANKSVLSVHFYEPPDWSEDIQFAGVLKKTKQLNCASFLSEFGVSACGSCSNTLAASLMDLVDTSLLSGWLYWDYKPMTGPKTGFGYSLWFANGTEDHRTRALVARTYAQAVAGIPISQFFDRATKVFSLAFTTDSSVNGNYETEIYYNQMYHYPAGFQISITQNSPDQTVQVPFVRTPTHIKIQTPPSLLPFGTTINVKITPM